MDTSEVVRPLLTVLTAYTTNATASIQLVVITPQPVASHFAIPNNTLATTPSPRAINSAVPGSSARKEDMGSM